MTEREPDPLFDALREQLADYGQEPPAQLWAGIRQQLPPPVAAPQRRRRRGAALLLAALLLLLSVGSWLATPPGRLRHQAGRAGGPAVATGPPNGVSARNNAATILPPAAAEQAAAAPASSSPTNAAPAGSAPAVASAAPDALTAQPGVAGRAVAPAVAATAAIGRAAAVAPGRLASSASATAAPAARPAHSPARHSAGVAASVTSARPGEHARRRRSAVLLAAQAKGLKTAKVPGRPAGQPVDGAAAANPVVAAAAARSASAPATAATPAAHPDAGQPAATAAGATSALPTTLATAAAMPGSAPIPSPSVAEATAPVGPAAGAARPLAADDGLALRPVSLLRQPWPAPAVRLSADTLPRPGLPPVRRWAVQVVLGPSLSYRQLTPAASLATMPSTIPGNTTNADIRITSSSDVATLERPALGFSGQVQLRRVLTGRWALSGGLGYRQYATALALQLYRPLTAYELNNMAPLISDSSHIGTIERRNTYGYLTVPVQASYALGRGWGRLQPSLLAGAELGLYLGGTTTEGSACNCPARTWTATNSPYRPLSLALTLGLELRYRLGPLGQPWELLAQPTFTYGLGSVTRAGGTYAERRPYAAGLQLGAAYHLH